MIYIMLHIRSVSSTLRVVFAQWFCHNQTFGDKKKDP